MRAAVVERVGEVPALRNVPEPVPALGESLISVTAAPLNPVDLSTAAGRFWAGAPRTPYVPGNEAVGRVLASEVLAVGARGWFESHAGYGADGTLAERATALDEAFVPVPDQVDDALAASLGIVGLTGWLALEWRAALASGETVLVLGATGAVGQIAVQVARILGAGRIVAAGRDPEALAGTAALGADATVVLGEGDSIAALREATGGGADVIVDPLWGGPGAAAVAAAAPEARVVQLGQSAGAESTLRSGDVRGKRLSILGFALAAVPRETKAAASAIRVR